MAGLFTDVLVPLGALSVIEVTLLGKTVVLLLSMNANVTMSLTSQEATTVIGLVSFSVPVGEVLE
jgi:hypothetical protein